MSSEGAKRAVEPTSGCGGLRHADGDGYGEFVRSLIWGAVILTPMLALSIGLVGRESVEQQQARLQGVSDPRAYERLIENPPGAMLAGESAARGKALFATTCVACHGPDGRGVRGLGKTLVESDFVALQSDEQLHRFIVTGRPNAKPVAMPPKAGRDDLSDADIAHIVAYVRGLQDPRRMPKDLPEVAIAAPMAPTKAQEDAALAAAGGDAELAKYIANGDRLFHSVCVACHGKGGVGLAGNGKPLVNNAFVRSLDEDALLAFLTTGRAPGDPKNTTGIQMPPKGGNPALSEDDLLDIIDYLRTLQGDQKAK